MKAQLQVLAPEYCDQVLYLYDLKLDNATEFCAAAPQEDFPYNFRASGPCRGQDITLDFHDVATR
jgi:hypothetical protein